MTTDREILELAADGLQHIAVFGELQNALEKIDILAADPTFVIGSSKELNAIHAVIMSIGGDWPEVEGDPYTLWHVKQMARELSAFQRAAIAQQVAVPQGWKTTICEISDYLRTQVSTKAAHDLADACEKLLSAAPQPPQQAAVPQGPEREHITGGKECWCHPEVSYIDPITGIAVIVHHKPN